MKTNKDRAGNKDWLKADARVLGQILAAQNIEFALPDTTHIAEFFAETLITIPGIMSCRVCLEDVTIQKGEMGGEICEECQALQKKAAGHKEIPSYKPDFRCRLADQPGMQFNAIDSLHHHFGFFVFQIDDPDVFNVYKPFIGNLANYVAISLENRLQRDLLQEARNELEFRVAERTEELHTSNEASKDLYNNAPCGYHSLDKDGFFILINDTELRWLGYSRDEIVGKVMFRDLLTANSRKTFEANFPGFKERGWVSDLEFEMVRKDGSILPVILNATAITDSDGNYVMSRSTIFDITERKRVEEALQESGMHYRQIVDLSQDMIVIHQQGKIVFINEAGVKLSGASSPDQIIGRSVLEFVPPSRKKIAQERMQSSLAEGEKSPVYEQKLRRFDGTEIDIDVRGMPIHYRGEEAIQFVARDITERKQAEEALRKSEAGLKEAQRVGRLGSWDWDAVTDTITWSEEYYRIYGFDPNQRPPGYVEHLKAYTPESAARLDAAVKKNMETGEAYALDLELVRADGPSHWITARSETKRDANGQIVGLRGTAQDITERKRAEEEIRKLNQELEQRVIDRTAQLEAANKELEAFAYSVSHDLRAPLRHIDGFIEMLQKRTKTTLDDQSRHYMAVITDSVHKMGTLIDDLLSFSRMGRNEMFKSQVDLDELVRDVIQESRPEAEGRDIQWEISPLPWVTGDRAMLRAVLVNLVSNALKFTRPRKMARIEIGCERKNETEAVIFVRDNGVGFDMNYASKLFGVFQRLHRQEDFEGTGIGLANVHRIVGRHGGRTWAEGEIDHGATFYISLPTLKQEIS